MARFYSADTSQLEAFLNGITKLEADIDNIADEVLDEAAPIVEKSLSSAISSVTTRGYSTGGLASSIAATKAKKNKYGHFTAIRPVGSNSKGVRYGEIMAYLEYGTSKQAARPVSGKAMSSAQSAVENSIKQSVESKIQSLVK